MTKENQFQNLIERELENVYGGDLLTGAVIVLGAVDMVLAGFNLGYALVAVAR